MYFALNSNLPWWYAFLKKERHRSYRRGYGFSSGHVWHRRIDAFELWCWRRLLRVPWTARRSNQSILKEISPGCSLEGLMLKLNSNTLATWCEELTHLQRPWCWERLRAGGEGDDRGWDGWMASPTRWTWVWVDSRSWWWTGRPGVLRKKSDMTERLNWIDLTFPCFIFLKSASQGWTLLSFFQLFHEHIYFYLLN